MDRRLRDGAIQMALALRDELYERQQRQPGGKMTLRRIGHGPDGYPLCPTPAWSQLCERFQRDHVSQGDASDCFGQQP